MNITFKRFMFIVFVLGIVGIGYMVYSPSSCVESNYYLVEQHIGTIEPNYTIGLTLCENCLIMTVKLITTVQSPPNNPNITVFFANEHTLREDLQEDTFIWINWCEGNNNRKLIRGVR